MATTKVVKRLPSGRVSYRGETFAGYNKPKRTPGKAKKSAVLAKKGTQVKLVRFGDPNMSIKKRSPEGVKTFELGTRVIPQKINLRPDIGPARHGDMKVEEVLKLLEKHEKSVMSGIRRLTVSLKGLTFVFGV